MKVLRQLTLRNLKMNKTRTLVTIIGIMLSVALMTVVSCLFVSGRQTLINHAIQSSGNFDIFMAGDFTEENVNEIKANRDVESVYMSSIQGFAQFNDSKTKYNNIIMITGIGQNGFEDCFGGKLRDGRFPENDNEIVIHSSLNNISKKEYKIGDSLDLELGATVIKNDGMDDTYYYQVVEGYDYVVFEKKSYKIVGIVDYISGAVNYADQGFPQVFTKADFSSINKKALEVGMAQKNIFLKLKNEKDYIKVMAELAGIDEYRANSMWKNENQNSYYENYQNVFADNALNINDMHPNYVLLKSKMIDLSDETNTIIIAVSIVLMLIIMLSSIFIIRNSFAISITEKTKLYGMLSSVGATPKQIKRNVYYEGFVIGMIGIPVGILTGVGIAFLLTRISSYLLYSVLNGVDIAFCVSVQSIIIAALLGILTVFLSSAIPAERAARISPIEAIRSNKDIKIGKKKKEKSYKTPRIVSKVFGMGGSIAWKNLKRSKKQYRTTVISIVVSIAVYITVSSFVGYMFVYSSQFYDGKYYDIKSWGEYYSEDGANDSLIEKSVEDYERISSFDEVEDRLYSFETVTDYQYYFNLNKNDIPDELAGYGETSLYNYSSDDPANVKCSMNIAALPDEDFNDLCEKIGLSGEKIKSKCILLNKNHAMKYDEQEPDNLEKTTTIYGKFIKNPVGKKIRLYAQADDYSYIYNDDSYSEEDKKYYRDMEAEAKKLPKIDIEIGAEISGFPNQKRYEELFTYNIEGIMIVGRSWMEKNFGLSNMRLSNLCLKTSDPYQAEEKIHEYYENKDHSPEFTGLTNNVKEKNKNDSLVLVVQIFVYGFIAIISLIGITNIFNTITTNMRLRQKEFAMLRSVGMTGKEFDRMIALESFFYTFKAMLIGIPLGLIGGFLIYRSFTPNNSEGGIAYMFPWDSVLISFIAVLVIIWTIMMFSIRKVRRQNIIETIRNDNI